MSSVVTAGRRPAPDRCRHIHRDRLQRPARAADRHTVWVIQSRPLCSPRKEGSYDDHAPFSLSRNESLSSFLSYFCCLRHPPRWRNQRHSAAIPRYQRLWRVQLGCVSFTGAESTTYLFRLQLPIFQTRQTRLVGAQRAPSNGSLAAVRPDI